MAKFYVQSGSVRMVVHAHDSRAAAIWAVHRCLSRLMPFLGDDEPAAGPAPAVAPQLAATMHTSERGFDRSDSEEHDTFATMTEWNRLLVALDRLQARFEHELSAV